MKNKLLIALSALLLALPVHAEEEWELTVSPFLWMAGQKGDVATLPNTEPAEIDISFEDILENLDMTLMGIVEARKGKLLLFAEIFYIDLDTDEADTPGRAFSSVDYEQQLTGITFGGGYQWSRENLSIDFIGGVRYWEVDNELRLDGGILPDESTSKREDWVDPIVGINYRFDLSGPWSINGWVVGAVGGDSDSATDLYASVGYQFSNELVLSAGYRQQKVDYEEDGFVYDVEIYGPIIGLSFVL